MLMTEDQAMQKTCPVARAIDGRCIGGRCMAWRCVPGKKFEETKVNGFTVALRARSAPDPDRGYCGLAGRPE